MTEIERSFIVAHTYINGANKLKIGKIAHKLRSISNTRIFIYEIDLDIR